MSPMKLIIVNKTRKVFSEVYYEYNGIIYSELTRFINIFQQLVIIACHFTITCLELTWVH